MSEFNAAVAVITGAGQGIGFEIGSRLASLGASIVLNDLDADLAADAAARICALGGHCLPLPGNAADPGFIQRLIDTAVRAYGKLDICIANAGSTARGSFLSFDPADLQRILDLNLQGSFILAQAAARQMCSQGKGGSILFMSSVTGHRAHKELVAYGMTKAALEMLARGLVAELSEFGIAVNSIAPGATLTERTLVDPTYEKVWSALTPMGRPATVSDIAHAAVFMVSPLSRHITGQTLIIDGGWSSLSPQPI